MKLPRDLSGAEVTRRLARHDDYRVSHMTVTRRPVPAGQREGRLRDRLHAVLLQAKTDADARGDPG